MRFGAQGVRVSQSAELKLEVQGVVVLLQTLRDEVRASLRLAGLETPDEWRKLEQRIVEVEQTAERATESSRHVLGEVVRRVKAFHHRQVSSRA